MRNARIVLLVLMLVLVAGCSSGAESSESASLEDRIFLAETSLVERFDAAEVRIADCMQTRGFEYQVRRLQPAEPSPLISLSNIDEALVRELGFGIATAAAEPEVAARVENTVDDPNVQILEMLGGNDARQRWREQFTICRETAHDDLGPVEGSDETESLRSAYFAMLDRVFSDERVTELNEEWSACFAARGFGAFDSIQDAVRSYSSEVQGDILAADLADDQPTLDAMAEREREYAVAAAQCAQPLAGRYRVILQEYERDLLSGRGE